MVTSKVQKQSKKNFTIVFIATIIVTRIMIFLIPRNSFIYTYQFHHIFIGIFLLIIYIFFRNQYLLAILLGLIIDQITQSPFYIANLYNKPITSDIFWGYWSSYTVISTLIAIIISIFLINKYKK